MKAVQVDERNSEWEGSDPAFKVILFEPAGSWAVDTWDLSECGVLDAIRWAQRNVAANGAWALGLIAEQPDGEGGQSEGFIYLEGFDLNAQAQDLSPWERRQSDEMLQRRATRVLL